jgi:hypothetical protein
MFQIREAQAVDALAIAALHVQTFNETHCGGEDRGPSLELRSRQWSELFANNDGSWFCYVAVDNLGNFIGFARGTPHDGGVPGYQGELNKIYVQRCIIGKGLESSCCWQSCANLSNAASTRCCCSVTRAIRQMAFTSTLVRNGYLARPGSFMVDMGGGICRNS